MQSLVKLRVGSGDKPIVLVRIADFLGIAPFPSVVARIVHAYRYDRTISEEERRYLISIFEPEIRELERLLGWDCSAWLD